MKSKLLSDEGGTRTYVLVFDTGDEVKQGLLAFAGEHAITGAHLTAIGAFENVVLGYFEWDKKDYEKIPINEQVELVSLVGNIATKDGKSRLHAHAVVAKRDGTAHGGHLLEARVRPTLEVILTEIPKHLQRRTDERTGLALIDLAA